MSELIQERTDGIEREGQEALALLDRNELHGSVCDPVLSSMGFLNEIIDRYPQAISFAPGAPFPGLLDDVEVTRHIDAYAAYLRDEFGLTSAQARRRLYQYGPSRGLINDLIASFLKKDEGINVAARAIVVTVSCQEAIFLVLRALFASPSDVLAVANPSYVGVRGAARLLDIPVVGVDDSRDSVDLRQLGGCRA